MADVFVSYDKEDRADAERLVEALRAEGFSVWWDDLMSPHEPWDATIQRELDAARKVLVLWTPRSIESQWVREEALYARQFTPPKLVSTILDDCRVPIGFGLVQHLDLTDWKPGREHEAFSRMLDWLRSDEDMAQAAALEALETQEPAPRKAGPLAALGEVWAGLKGHRLFRPAVAGLGAVALVAVGMAVWSAASSSRTSSQADDEARAEASRTQAGAETQAEVEQAVEALDDGVVVQTPTRYRMVCTPDLAASARPRQDASESVLEITDDRVSPCVGGAFPYWIADSGEAVNLSLGPSGEVGQIVVGANHDYVRWDEWDLPQDQRAGLASTINATQARCGLGDPREQARRAMAVSSAAAPYLQTRTPDRSTFYRCTAERRGG